MMLTNCARRSALRVRDGRTIALTHPLARFVLTSAHDAREERFRRCVVDDSERTGRGVLASPDTLSSNLAERRCRGHSTAHVRHWRSALVTTDRLWGTAAGEKPRRSRPTFTLASRQGGFARPIELCSRTARWSQPPRLFTLTHERVGNRRRAMNVPRKTAW